MVPGGMRNIHESKGPMTNAAHHHSDRQEDYMSIVQRLGNEVPPALPNHDLDPESIVMGSLCYPVFLTKC